MRPISHTRRPRARVWTVCAVSVVAVVALGVGASPASAESKDPIAQLALRTLSEVRTTSTESALLFSKLRHQLAVAVARRTGVNAKRLEHAWVIAPREHQVAVIAALTQVGVPYRAYAAKPGVAVDCSSFTQYAWMTAGYSIPRKATRQGPRATRVTRKNLRAGDLVVRDTHVYMYLGVGTLVVHAPYTGTRVRFRLLPASRMASSRLSNPALNSDWKTPAPKVGATTQ